VAAAVSFDSILRLPFTDTVALEYSSLQHSLAQINEDCCQEARRIMALIYR